MSVFCAVIDIFLCFFAVLGLYFSVTKLTDRVAAKNAPSKCIIVIEGCAEDSVEYLIRFFESRLLYGDFEPFFDGITISPSVHADDALISRLAEEYGNIY